VETEQAHDRAPRDSDLAEHVADGTGVLIDTEGKTNEEIADLICDWARARGIEVID
jgi:hypothetical protein